MSKDILSSERTFIDKLRDKKSRATVLLAAAVLSACSNNEGGKVAAAPEAEPTATVTITEAVDSGSSYVPSEQIPFLRDTDPSLEEIKQPAVLNSEQLAAWQTGDAAAQTDVASYVIAPRISVAIHELYDAKKQGTEANIDWLTTDTGAIEGLEEVADYFVGVSEQIDPAEGVEWFGFDVCRSYNQADLEVIDRCHPGDFPDPMDFSEGNPMQFLVTRETSANNDSVEENAAFQGLSNSSVYLEGDTLVIKPIS